MMKGDLFMNLLGFNPYAFIETLPYMGKGMLGIFIVIGIIIGFIIIKIIYAYSYCTIIFFRIKIVLHTF